MNHEEIHSLLAKYLSGNALPEEALRVEEWLSENEGNRKYIEEAQQAYLGAKIPEAPVDSAWQKLKPQLRNTKGYGIQTMWLGIAASLIVVSGLFYYLLVSPPLVQPVAPAILAFESHQKDTTIVLQNGNQVLLLPNSGLIADEGFGKTNRLMRLKGSGYFHIQSHDSLPLTIQSGQLFIRDIGTRFWVQSAENSDTILVKVEEGRVFLFDSMGTSKKLSAGEEIRYSKHRGAFLQTQYRDTLHFSFHFNNQKLEEVLVLLENAYHKRIALENAALKNCQLTARFEKEDLETVLLVITETLNLSVETTPEGYLIKGELCR